MKKKPVYDRDNVLQKDEDVEAVCLSIDDKNYTLLVVHTCSAPAVHFFKVDDVLVHLRSGVDRKKMMK